MSIFLGFAIGLVIGCAMVAIIIATAKILDAFAALLTDDE